MNTATSVATGNHLFLRDVLAAGSTSVDSRIHLSSLAESLALCHRAAGSLARHFSTTRSSADDAGVESSKDAKRRG